jgi:phosphate transport system ATP-binding protein
VEGEIFVDGVNINGKDIDVVPLRARMGMVFQKPNPFPKSIFENVAFGPRIHGLTASKVDLEDIVVTSLQKAGLWKEVKDRLEEPGSGLSGGQQQRLCIARSRSSGRGHPDGRALFGARPDRHGGNRNLMVELSENYSICIVTHSMQQAARVSRRTALHLGDIIEVGETNEIFVRPGHQLAEDYITGRFG